jgi:short-subunit dehydrogenase
MPIRHKIRSRPFDLDGAVCVVTGASSGLGRRFALDLAARRATVFGLARRESLLESLQTELGSRSPRSQAIRCDVSDTGSFVSVLRSLEDANSGIDLLVNCAGIPEPAGTRQFETIQLEAQQFDAQQFEDQQLDPYRAVMNTNYFSAVAGTLAVLPRMLERDRGVIVNVSSDSGRAPGPDEPAYCASKAALSAFSESIALSVDSSGVHVHVLYPGWVPTAMGNGAVEAGMPKPPKFVCRTEEQVSALLMEKIGSRRIDIDATFAARLAPVARSIAPGAYKRGVLGNSGQEPTPRLNEAPHLDD